MTIDLPPTFGCTTRAAAIEALRRIARAADMTVDEYTAGKYTAFVPGRMALLVAEDSGAAWLCRVSDTGRLCGLEASAVWGMQE